MRKLEHVFPLGAVAVLLVGAMAAPARAQARRVIPENTVLRAELTEHVSSRDARRGDVIRARLSRDDYSGFPDGTRFEGTVTEVRHATDDRPAVLDVIFRRAILPDGSAMGIRGDLASLSSDDVRETSDGRLVSRRSGNGEFQWKWVGYGAAGGAVLGQIFGDDFLKGGLLGGLGGAVYSYLNRDKGRDFSEIDLDRGTEFGIRLDRRVAFDTRSDYRFGDRQRVLGSRQEFHYVPDQVYYNGRSIHFTDAQPTMVNGTLYLPLRPVAEAAGWNLRHYRGSDSFDLTTRSGRLESSVDERSARWDTGQRVDLDNAPMRIGGDIYVPMGYLSRVGDLRANWNRRSNRLDLTPY